VALQGVFSEELVNSIHKKMVDDLAKWEPKLMLSITVPIIQVLITRYTALIAIAENLRQVL